jgi:hypothetical protein
MDYEYFSYEVPRPHVAWVTIERPEVSNAINTPAHVYGSATQPGAAAFTGSQGSCRSSSLWSTCSPAKR